MDLGAILMIVVVAMFITFRILQWRDMSNKKKSGKKKQWKIKSRELQQLYFILLVIEGWYFSPLGQSWYPIFPPEWYESKGEYWAVTFLALLLTTAAIFWVLYAIDCHLQKSVHHKIRK